MYNIIFMEKLYAKCQGTDLKQNLFIKWGAFFFILLLFTYTGTTLENKQWKTTFKRKKDTKVTNNYKPIEN